MKQIIRAEFIGSFVEIEKCPHDKPEFAFIGRSNVGKSSLINMLINSKLAKISSKPGKTQTINFYLVNYLWYLVDLPGYGYAKTSKKQRDFFTKIINKYIFKSPNLFSLFVLVDSNIPPQKSDIEFINSLGKNGIPFSIVFTKSDKSSKNKISKNISDFKKEMLKTWEELPNIFVTSAKNNVGRQEIIEYIQNILSLYK